MHLEDGTIGRMSGARVMTRGGSGRPALHLQSSRRLMAALMAPSHPPGRRCRKAATAVPSFPAASKLTLHRGPVFLSQHDDAALP